MRRYFFYHHLKYAASVECNVKGFKNEIKQLLREDDSLTDITSQLSWCLQQDK